MNKQSSVMIWLNERKYEAVSYSSVSNGIGKKTWKTNSLCTVHSIGAMMLVLHFTGNYISAIKGIWRGVGFTFISRFDHCSLTRNSSKNAQPQIAPRTIIAAFGKGSQSISSISTITSQWKVTLEVLQTYPNI